MEFGVGVGGVPISGPARAKHHVATLHRALVHLSQVHSRKMDFQGPLITEGLQADVALHAFFPRSGGNVGHADVVPHLFANFGTEAGGTIIVGFIGRLTRLARRRDGPTFGTATT